ncbi:MAG: GNAT family N-acetyltransferase [Mycobacterium leprae]
MTSAGDPTIRLVGYEDPSVRALVDEVQQEYVARYGGPDRTPVTAGEFDPPGGAFLVLEVDGEAVGCGGLRRHDERTAEIKRMFVRRSARRRGHARRLLAVLEERARAAGYARVILETGHGKPEALALYGGAGYHPIAPFGLYRDAPGNRCFGKDLG